MDVQDSRENVPPFGLRFAYSVAKYLFSNPSARYCLLISSLVAASSYAILPTWLSISRIWIYDPLRSIGAAFPLLAFAGTVVAWRRIGWGMNGTFWGLPLVGLSILLSRFTANQIILFRIHQQIIPALHLGVVMFLYAVGAVLVFGGTRLLRASIAPVCLLLFINPVPHFFNAAFDLPLQYLSAKTALLFAHSIGLHPSVMQLRMMFTPNFGMMIVPGCNGVRGSVTLGYLSLIFGYMRHLRWRCLVLMALAAFLMGYALNLLRLCALVVYYRIGVSHMSIQKYGTGVDYVIGSTLFLIATLVIGLFIRSNEPILPSKVAATKAEVAESPAPQFLHATYIRAICFLILGFVFILPGRTKIDSFHPAPPNEQALFASFPKQVGGYKLIRTYDERDTNGLMQFAMADYSDSQDSSDANSKLTLGIYVGLGTHLVASSKYVQGLSPDWIGSFDVLDTGAQPAMKVHFATTFYDDGVSRQYYAESLCYETGCSASIDTGSKRLFSSTPTLHDLFYTLDSTRLSFVLRREFPDSNRQPVAMQLGQFESAAGQFVVQLDLRKLLHEDGNPVN